MGLDILSEAMGFAIAAHGGQPRKGDGSPMTCLAMQNLAHIYMALGNLDKSIALGREKYGLPAREERQMTSFIR